MKTVNFTKNLISLLATAMLCVFALGANAQVCSVDANARLNAPDDENPCQAVILVSDVAPGASTFTLVKLIEPSEHVVAPANPIVLDANAAAESVVVTIPGTYKYEVEEGCWGTFNVEDKSGPVCDLDESKSLEPITVSCTFGGDIYEKFTDLDAGDFYDCEKLRDEDVSYTESGKAICSEDDLPMGVQFDIPEGWAPCELYSRTTTIRDWRGNVSEGCTQYVLVVRPTIITIDEDVSISLKHKDGGCDEETTGKAYPYFEDLSVATYWGTGETMYEIKEDGLCKYALHIDEGKKHETCNYKLDNEGLTYKQTRTISVIDICTGDKIASVEQSVEVVDEEAPVVTEGGPMSAWGNPYDCSFDVTVPALKIWDCSAYEATATAYFVAPHAAYGGGASPSVDFNPAVGTTINNVPAGAEVIVTVTAWDACGNQEVEEFKEVIEGDDDFAPICVANDELEVSLINVDGHGIPAHTVGARVYPEDIDDTSRDNCAIDYMKIRKAEHHGDLKDTEGWEDYVEYTYNSEEYALIAGEKCQVEVWVDLLVVDKAGNSSICPSRLILRDNTAPVLDELEDQYVDCLWEDKAAFDTPDVWGNCFEMTEDTDEVVYHCPTYVDGYDDVIKKITKTWTVTKKTEHGASKSTTSQNIYIYSVDEETFTFPYDYKAECSSEGIPAAASLSDILDNKGCSEWVMNVSEREFLGDEESCYKIIRTYEFINWCRWDNVRDAVAIDKDCADHNYDGKLLEEDGDYQVTVEYGKGSYIDDEGEVVLSSADDKEECYRPRRRNVRALRSGHFTYTQIIKISDSVDPTGDVESKVSCDPSIAGCHQGIVEFTASGADVCSSATVGEMYVDAVSAYGDDVADKFTRSGNTMSATGLPAGTYTVHARIDDACGNFIWVTETVEVEQFDCKKPTVIGLANFTALMENCTVDIWLSDILTSYDDNCLDAGQYGGLTFGMEVANDGVSATMPTAQSVTLSTAGTNSVALWAMDAAGNTQYTIVPVIAQDNAGNCGANDAAVVGSITNENDEMIDNVTVSAKGSNMVDFTSIFNGSFNLTAVPMNSDVTIAAEKNIGHLNGVSTADLVLLQRHVLGITPLNSAYKLIAADANNDEKIDTRDMLHISRLVLGIYDELPNNTSWRFVDKAHNFANPTSPWGFPEAIDFQSLDADAQADFIGVKVGDLSGNATPSNLLGSDDTKVGTMNIAIEDATIAAGETQTIEFTTADFNGFAGYQFSIALDSRVSFNGISAGDLEGVSEANFGLANLESGVITTNWSDVEGVTVENGTVMFSLTVTATETVNVSEIVSVNSAVTSAEAYNSDLDVYTVGVQFNRAASTAFELFQNVPNPVSGETVIGFNLPTAGAATLKVMDVAGRTIHTVSNTFAAGFNQIALDKADLSTTGVLYYQLDTDNNSATKKMVILE